MMAVVAILVMILFILYQIYYPVYSQIRDETERINKIKKALDKSVGLRNYILVSISRTGVNEFARDVSDKIIYDEVPLIEILNDKKIDWGILSEEEKEMLDEEINTSSNFFPKNTSIKKAVSYVDKEDVNVYHRPPNEAYYLEAFKDEEV